MCLKGQSSFLVYVLTLIIFILFIDNDSDINNF